MKHLLKIWLLIFFPTLAFSQAAVHLNCIYDQNHDIILHWNNPTNPCPAGCFVDYEIYFSHNNSPYALATSIANPLQDTFKHANINPSGDTFYYYIQTVCNCGGGNVYSYSDTVNNVAPDIPTINFVTVNGNKTILNWTPNTTTQTFAYIIYYQQGGFLSIDTIYGNQNFQFDTTYFNPNTTIVTYSIAAMDSCGTTSWHNTQPQNTILLSIAQDRCNHSLTLTWNAYQNWQQGVKQYEIFESINNAAFQMVKTVSPTNFACVFNNVKDGDKLCFYVQARESILNDTSQSNHVCVSINVVQPSAYTYYQSASVFLNKMVMLDFLPDTVADVKSFNILEGSTYGHYSYAFTVAATKPQTPIVTTSETTTLIHQQPIYYFIQAVDSCGKIFAGTHCQTIYLKGDIIGSNQTTLNWTPYAVDSGVVHTYDVLRSDDGGQNFVLIGSVDSNTFVYHDNLQQFATSPDSFCYRIQAHFNFSNKRFATGDHVSLSNDWCTHCYSEFFAPNTIFPKGKNNLFKPIITFPDILNYQMIIFNRYGEKIFIGNDYNTGWNGTFNGNEVPQGNYTYLITFEKPDGKKFVQQGNVVVIY